MNRILNMVLVTVGAAGFLPLYGGESSGLIVNLKESKPIFSFKTGLRWNQETGPRAKMRWQRSIESITAYIQAYEPALMAKLKEVTLANNNLINTVEEVNQGIITSFRELIAENPFENVTPKMIAQIKQTLSPLEKELKRAKGSVWGNISLKKSEPRKVFDEFRSLVIQSFHEVAAEYKQLEKDKIIN